MCVNDGCCPCQSSSRVATIVRASSIGAPAGMTPTHRLQTERRPDRPYQGRHSRHGRDAERADAADGADDSRGQCRRRGAGGGGASAPTPRESARPDREESGRSGRPEGRWGGRDVRSGPRIAAAPTDVHFLAGSWQTGVNRCLSLSTAVTLYARKPLETQRLGRFCDSGEA